MAGPDEGRVLTEKALAALEARIGAVYRQAHQDLDKTVRAYFAALAQRDEAQRALLEAGEITGDDYRQWRLNQIGRGRRWEALRDQAAERMTRANETAVSYVNDTTPGIYSLNRNYAAYTIERVAGDVGFTLWDEQTVRRLIVERPDLMPYYPPQRAVRRGIDLAYGRQQITASVTSAILQGRSVKHMADDLQARMTTMSRDSAIRTARTAVTGAQNAGRLDGYAAAEKMGVKLQKQWLATLDGRTRHSHAALDGEKADNDRPFSNGCMFPGDPSGAPKEVYNCRCTLIADVAGADAPDALRRDRDGLLPDMTFAQWEAGKRGYTAEPISNIRVKELAGWHKALQDQKKVAILNEKELYSLNQYKSSAVAYPLNAILRGEAPMTEEFQQIVQDIDQVLSKLPRYEGMVYRSLSSKEMADAATFLALHAPGARLMYPAYTSCATEVYDSTMDIQLLIQSKRGRDMRKYNPLEQEILFERGSTFFVDKREGNTIWLTEI